MGELYTRVTLFGRLFSIRKTIILTCIGKKVDRIDIFCHLLRATINVNSYSPKEDCLERPMQGSLDFLKRVG